MHRVDFSAEGDLVKGDPPPAPELWSNTLPPPAPLLCTAVSFKLRLWICCFVLSKCQYLWHQHWHAADNPPCDCQTNWGSALLQTGECGEGHGGNVQSGAGPFGSLPFLAPPARGSSLYCTLAFFFSAHSCWASTGRELYYGWVNLLINIQPLDPAFPRWPIKNYNWQRI